MSEHKPVDKASDKDSPEEEAAAVQTLENETEKRQITLTDKGIHMHIENVQKERKAMFAKATKVRKQIEIDMQTADKVSQVRVSLKDIVEYCDRATKWHDQFMQYQFTEEEWERQESWFRAKKDSYDQFVDHVNKWLADNTVQPQKANENNEEEEEEEEDDDDDDEEDDDGDGVNPEDSVSNVAKQLSKMHVSKTGSITVSSTTSSAYRQAQAEQAALLERAAALDAKHALEAEEEKLERQKEKIKRQKEKLAMDTELKATKAKLQVLEQGSGVSLGAKSKSSKTKGSKGDGMNAYLAKTLNPIPLEPPTKLKEPPPVVTLHAIDTRPQIPKSILYQPPTAVFLNLFYARAHFS